MTENELEISLYRLRFKEEFGELCWDIVMNNAISEEELYEMIPYVAEYMNIRRSKDLFINAMKQGLYKY